MRRTSGGTGHAAPFAEESHREINRYVVDGAGDDQKFLIRVRPEPTAGARATDSTVRVIVNWQSSIATN